MSDRPPEQRVVAPFLRYWLPVLAYVAVIFAVSAQPRLQPPIRFDHADKFYHVLEYLGLGLLLARALRASGVPGWRAPAALIAIACGAAVGAADEVFQSFVPGRESSVLDVAADLAGVALAQLVYPTLARLLDPARGSG